MNNFYSKLVRHTKNLEDFNPRSEVMERIRLQLNQTEDHFDKIKKQFRKFDDPFKNIRSLQLQFKQSTNHIDNVKRHFQNFDEPFENIKRLHLQFKRSTDHFDNIKKLFQPIDWNAFFETNNSERCIKLGWLPHHSIFEIIKEFKSDTEADAEILEKIKICWPKVKEDLVAELQTSNASDETKNCILEAIEMHENAHFTSVVRTIFVEIESMIRVEFEISVHRGISSLKDFLNELGNLPIDAVISGGTGGLHIFKLFSSHLYDHINDENKLDHYKKSAIPNRHAAIHGHIRYSTFQSSLNSLLFMSYVMRWTNEMIKMADEESEQIEITTKSSSLKL